MAAVILSRLDDKPPLVGLSSEPVASSSIRQSPVVEEGRLMSLLTVEGTYKNGRIELTEQPDGIGGETRVLVTFLASAGADVKPPVEATEDRETLRQRAFARMKEGLHLGGPPYPKREELYDRFDK